MARPKVGDAVNNAAPTFIELPPGIEGVNGVVTYVNHEDKIVMVKYQGLLGMHEHDLEEFHGCWTDKFGGLWHLGA